MSIRILPLDELGQALASVVDERLAGGELSVRARERLMRVLAPALVGPAGLAEFSQGVSDLGRDVPHAKVTIESLALDEVLEKGLGVLSGEALVGLAFDGDTMRELNEIVRTALAEQCAGKYWEDAEQLPDDRFPADYLPASLVTRLLPRAVPAVRSDRLATPDAGRARKWPVWAAMTAATAASFLVGLFLGTRTGDGNQVPAFALADVKTVGETTRGVDGFKLEVTNDGAGKAYVTVLGFVPGSKHLRSYNGGPGFLVAPPRTKIEIKNLPREFEGATVLLVVLCNVPAGEAISKSAPPEVSADRAADVVERLKSELAALNVRAEIRLVVVGNN
jgi:hypothetical protein